MPGDYKSGFEPKVKRYETAKPKPKRRVADDKSAADRGRAQEYERTPEFRKAVRKTYDSQPSKRRKQIADAAEKRPGPAADAITKVHRERLARNMALDRAAAQKDTKGDRDRRRAVPVEKKDDRGLLERTLGFLYPKSEKKSKGSGRIATGVAPNVGVPLVGSNDAITRRLRNLGVATYEDPTDVALSTAKSVPQVASSAVSLGASVIGEAKRGETKTLRSLPGAALEDYKRRYGATDEEAQRQFKEEGFLPEALDVASVAAPTGVAVGRVLGKVGPGKRIVNTPRPMLRVVQGGAAVPQARSKNLFGALNQNRVDRARARDVEVRQARAERGGAPFRGVVPDKGEVVYKESAITGLRKQNRAQRRAVSKIEGRAQVRARSRRQRELKEGTERDLKDLTDKERAAFAYVLGMGLKPGQEATRVLAQRRDQIIRERARKGIEPEGNQADELKVIDQILAEPELHITENVRRAADINRERAARLGADDPSFGGAAAIMRAVQEQALHLGVKRGGVPVKYAEKAAKERVKKAEAEVVKAERKAKREFYKTGFVEGRATVLAGQASARTRRAAAGTTEKPAAWFKPGGEFAGRGMIDSKGRLHTWGEDEGTHAAVANAKGVKARDSFMLRPDGTVRNHGGSDVPDALLQARVHTQDPRVPMPDEASLRAIRDHYADEGRRFRRRLDSKLTADERKWTSGALREARQRHKEVERLLTLDRKPKSSLDASTKAGARYVVATQAIKKAERQAKEAKAELKQVKKAKAAGVELLDAEAPESFVARVQKRAGKQGLEPGGYFPAVPRLEGVHSAFTTGDPAKAMPGTKKSEGKLFRTGTRNTDAVAFVTALANNLKRPQNWNMVADIWEANTPSWGRNLDIPQLKRQIEKRRLDPSDWVVVDPGRYRKALAEDADLDAAMGSHTYTLMADGTPAGFKGTGRGFSLVPRVVADELKASATPSTFLGRGVGNVQGLTSKTLLNTNPTFVPVQIVSNASLVAMMAPRALIRAMRAQKWYRGLDAQTKELLDGYMGTSAAADAGRTTRYGASPQARMSRGFAGFTQAWGERMGSSKFNPMQWNPHMDAKQNAFFRKSVMYDEFHRQAAAKMGRDMRAIHATAPKVLEALDMPPGPDKVKALRELEPQIEEVAGKVDSILGNYTAYTAFERKTIKRALLFYGFLRWSLQFTFYTLPVKHPAAVSIMGKLAQLQREEIINLIADQAASKGMGAQEEIENLIRAGHMPYVFGRVWMLKDGSLESIDLTRVNPMMNPLMDVLEQGPFRAGAGLASPALQAAGDVAYGRSLFKRQDLKNARGEPLSGADQASYVAGQLGRLAFPARIGEKLLTDGQQGDEAIPFLRPAPKEINTPDQQATASARAKERGSDAEVVLDALLPLIRSKQDGTLRGVAATLDRQRKAGGKKKPKDPLKSLYGGGGSDPLKSLLGK